jgi:aspartyl-tRNA(Asn)/glutamyl-tRNA(Gln) amidotransferase subunit B
VSPVGVANWITGDFAHLINDRGVDISAVHVRPGDVGALVGMVERREITGAAGKQVLEEMFRTGESPADIVDRLDLRQVGDEAALESLADKVLTENPALVQTYKSGKLNAIQAMVGRAMAESKGKANPQRMREILEAKLS